MARADVLPQLGCGAPPTEFLATGVPGELHFKNRLAVIIRRCRKVATIVWYQAIDAGIYHGLELGSRFCVLLLN